jgi:hypothetical protein
MMDCSGGLAGRAAGMESTCKIEMASRGYKYVEVTEVFILIIRLRSDGFLFLKSVNYSFGFALSSVLPVMVHMGKNRGGKGVW